MESTNEMEKTIQKIKEDNVALMAENTVLRRRIGGYKKSNEEYRKKIERLGAQVENLKLLNSEADQLYEDTLGEVEKKRKIIEGLHSQVARLAKSNAELESTNDANKDLIAELEKNLSESEKPWWKKIF